MKKEGGLYLALFLLLLGFMSFSLTLLNKQSEAIMLLSKYYVVAVFLSVLCSIVGSAILLHWHVTSSSPFKEAEKKSPYAYYMVVGAFLIFIGLGFFVLFTQVGRSILILSAAVALVGIGLLLRGFVFYLEEIIKKRTFLHS
jgi:hypothetical protein